MVLKIHMHFKKCIAHSTTVLNTVRLNCSAEVLRSDKLCLVQAQKRIVKESGLQVMLCFLLSQMLDISVGMC